MGSYNRNKKGVCAKKGESVSIVKRGKGRSEGVYKGAAKERIYLASKSLQMALVFFIGKKNGKKRMVQDYKYLNEWMIKNNYSLPLISDVLENIRIKKVFTKMDLR